MRFSWGKRILLIFVVALILFIALSLFGYVIWGRRVIYPDYTFSTDYPGSGKITFYMPETLWVFPILGGPFFTDTADYEMYNGATDLFSEVYKIPSHDHLDYVVGRFSSWEHIEGSKDKYLVITNPETKEKEKYRVCFEQSELFGINPTIIWIEKISIILAEDEKNPIVKEEPNVTYSIGYDNLKKKIFPGDAVVIMTTPDPVDFVEKDQQGVILAGQIVLRRANFNLLK